LYNVFWVFIWSNAIHRFVRSPSFENARPWLGVSLAVSLLLEHFSFN
jgi:hypothetical protein